jgi:hypothetical protein
MLGRLDTQEAWKVAVEFPPERSAVVAVDMRPEPWRKTYMSPRLRLTAALNLTLDKTTISTGAFAADAEALKR